MLFVSEQFCRRLLCASCWSASSPISAVISWYSSSRLVNVQVFPDEMTLIRPQKEASSVSGVMIVNKKLCLFLISFLFLSYSIPMGTDKKLTQRIIFPNLGASALGLADFRKTKRRSMRKQERLFAPVHDCYRLRSVLTKSRRSRRGTISSSSWRVRSRF